MRRRIVVTGATGLLGGYVVAEARRRAFDVVSFGGPSRADGEGLDLTSEPSVRSTLEEVAPHAVIHAAALSAMADCARDPERAKRVNVDGTRHVALACRSTNARLVHVSTDLVFDGEAAPYRETDAPSPISVYGRTKLAAEHEALSTNAKVTVVRVSLLFGPTRTGRQGFFDSQLEAFRAHAQGDPPNITLFDDEWRTPLSLRAAAEGLVAIASSDATANLLHFGGPERLSRLEMGEQLRDLVAPGVPIRKGSRLSAPGEPRPRDVSLDSTSFRRAFPEIAMSSFREEALEMMAVNTKRDTKREGVCGR